MLYILDVDGTLVETYGEAVLPGVAERLTVLAAQGHSFAVATNQAGPAWGLATGKTKFPDPAELGARLARIAHSLSPLASAPWYAAIGDGRLNLSSAEYQTIQVAMRRGAGALDLRVEPDLAWRKPAPGMLRSACAYYGLSEGEALFVGDSDADVGAAASAEMRFAFADGFFGVSDTGDLTSGG